MFWPVMFEAASNVGPEGPLKKMPILVLEIPGHTASSHAHTASTQAQQTADSRRWRCSVDAGGAVWSVEGGAWDIVYVKKKKHACMGRVQAFRTPWSRRRCPARRGCVCSREKLTMLRWYFIQCIKPACSCSNKVCCTSKGATAKKKNDVCTNIRI